MTDRPGPLDPAEVATYHRDGLVLPRYRLPEAMLGDMRAAFDQLAAANPHLAHDIMVCPHLRDHGAQGLKGDPVWLDFACHPPLLDMLEQLIGPDLMLWGTTIFGKPARHGKDIPWHQDADLWPIRPPATVTIWIALEACTPENGCLRYIPGTQHGPLPHHAVADEAKAVRYVLDPGAIDEGDARDLVLEPGRMSIHHSYIVHGSRPNRSGRPRTALALRYMPSSAVFDHASGREAAARAQATANSEYTTRPLYLLRGIDRSGRNDFQIGH